MLKRIFKRKLIFNSILLMLYSCNHSVVESISYNIEIKDNVIFYLNDTKEYHLDSFILTQKSSITGSRKIEFEESSITEFNTNKLGENLVSFSINNQELQLNIRVVEKDIQYTKSGKSVTITNFNNIKESVIVPRTVEGLNVVKLDWPSFYENKVIKSVSLPEGLLELGDGVFENSSIESIVLPESLEVLGVASFAGSSLKKLKLNRTIDTIPMACFEGTQLKNLIIPGNIKSIETGAFSNSNIEEIIFEEGIRSIKNRAFAFNSIKEIVFPKDIEEIGKEAFSRNNLKKITLNHVIPNLKDNSIELTTNDVYVYVIDHYNNKSELERIFGVEPLVVNDIHKPQLFTLDEVLEFKKWSNKKRALLTLGKNYRFERTNATEYKLNYTIGIYSNSGELVTYQFNVENIDNIFHYTEKINNVEVKKDIKSSLVTLLLNK